MAIILDDVENVLRHFSSVANINALVHQVERVSETEFSNFLSHMQISKVTLQL